MTTQIDVDNFHHYDRSDLTVASPIWLEQSKKETIINYDFTNHFHPYIGHLIQQLNKGSVSGLLHINTQKREQTAEYFRKIYEPISRPKEDQNYNVTFNKKEIDLSCSEAYSIYNWELFFHVPMIIAVHLSKNQRFKEAQQWFHFIFNPMTNDKSTNPTRFWNFRPFAEKPDVQLIDDLLTALSEPDDESKKELKQKLEQGIENWRSNPFQPHVVARTRPLAYRFNVVMKYLDNLVAWGDSLFRQDTIETINEATQLYVLAANILGPRPQEVPRAGTSKPKSYASLRNKWDAFGNALVEMEGQYPYNLNVPSVERQNTNQTKSLFGVGRSLYFCIPKNDRLLSYWDTIADRLFKIRHCMNIEGVARQLPLFQPSIDPGLLVKAAAAGIDLNSVISGQNQTVSTVRSIVLFQKALEICNDVRTLGNAFLSAAEKGDAEALSLLRQEQEIRILKLVEDFRFLQWKEAENATQSLLKTRDTVFERYRHYQLMLGKTDNDLSTIKTLQTKDTELNKENFDTAYKTLVTDYEKLIELEGYPAKEHLGEGELNLNRNEYQELNEHMPASKRWIQIASINETITSALYYIPKFKIKGSYWGIGPAADISGGQFLGSAGQSASSAMRLKGNMENAEGSAASRTGSYERRTEEWILQNNLAAKELMQIGRQVIASLIREQITKKEYESHKEQIENALEIQTFLKEKFSNQELYTWMQGETSKIYYESYKFAFDIAKKAEQTMKHEVMRKELDERDFIKFNYWDTGRKGLLSGEALYLDLKRMEMAYHDYNKREYELTRHISLQQLDPIALLQLKTTARCEFALPEWLFDLGCPGHYMRRIKTISVSIPCIVGPYSSVNCTLSLRKSSLRISSVLKEDQDDRYRRLPAEDDRFKDHYGTIQSIVTSTAQNDSGVFELNLRDEHFLPFEGAGAESSWTLELPSEHRQFDYNSISDVIIHMRYTARQGGDRLKKGAESHVKTLLNEVKSSKLVRLFSLNHDFADNWYRFVASGETTNFSGTIKKDNFPYLASGLNIVNPQLQLFSVNDRDLSPIDAKSIVEHNLDQININGEAKIELSKDYIDKEAQIFLAVNYSVVDPT